MEKIVIIIPTYNERDNINPLVEEIQKQFKHLPQYLCSILIVDDESPDNTVEIVKELIKKYKNIDLLVGKKKGLGNAYSRGMIYAIEKMNADIFFEMDADFSHDPKLIPKFISEIENGSSIVIGSRYIKGGSIPKEWGIDRKLYSYLGNLFVRFGLMLLRVRDWTSGYRAFRKEVFEQVGGNMEKYTGYTFQVALLHRSIKDGFSASEIPLQFIDRKYGKSKIIPGDYIKNLFMYVLLNSSFIKFLVVGVCGFTIQTIIAKILITSKFHPGISVGIGAEAAIIANFHLNQFWTFSHKRIRGKKKYLKKFISFNSAAVSAIVIQIIAVTLGTGIFGHEFWFISMVASIIIFVIPYSYFMYHKVIWKDNKLVTS